MQNRAIIENVKPNIGNGNYQIKRTVGEQINVSAYIYGDGHDEINARIIYKGAKQKKWNSAPLRHIINDEWKGTFALEQEGNFMFTIEAWVDHPLDWLIGIRKKIAADIKVNVEIKIGVELLNKITKIASPKAKTVIKELVKTLGNDKKYDEAIHAIKQQAIEEIIVENKLIEHSTIYEVEQPILVESKKALFSSWYEFFPRSASQDIHKNGTFKDCEKVLPFVANLGFDVLYFPPIHPIGINFRKGKNNSTTANVGEPGSPWAIGSADGGHKSINKELGTLADFKKLVAKAKSLNIDIAMDIAFQASQDHPYVKENPQWFKWRPDGTVQYAENPPKKYQDVLPFNFECDDWQALWKKLLSVVMYWIEQGITIFRVDNPHTKPFIFWEWLIKEVNKKHKNIFFLSEAFTRPKIMAKLGKIGFTQSYTYFTWRVTKPEIIEYMNELTQSELREYFRPNFWPNTPDILPFHLHNKGYAASAIRFVLAATLSSNYGMYGPVYDMLETEPFNGKEEYNNSEKYEARVWDWTTMTPMRILIKQINELRHHFDALQTTYNIEFTNNDNPMILSFIKHAANKKDSLYIVINLDDNFKQSGYVAFDATVFGKANAPAKVKDLLTNIEYDWNTNWNYVELDTQKLPAHIFQIL